MKPIKGSRTLSLGLVTTAAILGVTVSDAANAWCSNYYSYKASYVCDYPQGVAGGVSSVKYATLINVMNAYPNSVDVEFTNFAAPNTGGGLKEAEGPYVVGSPYPYTIAGPGGVSLGCRSIQADDSGQEVNLPPVNGSESRTGFIKIWSPKPLDVAVTQTLRNDESEQFAVDVEYIEPREVRVCGR